MDKFLSKLEIMIPLHVFAFIVVLESHRYGEVKLSTLAVGMYLMGYVITTAILNKET